MSINILLKVFITLVLFTVFTFSIGWLELNYSIIIVILLITTFIKGHLIIEYFMGLKSVKGKFRYIPTIWLSIILLIIGILYYI